MKGNNNLQYEERGIRRSTLWFKTIVFGLLNLYPLYLALTPLYVRSDIVSTVITLVSILLFILGVFKLDTITTIFSLVVPVITAIVLGVNYPVYTIVYYVIWVFISDYIVEIVFKEKTFTKWSIRLYSPLITIAIFTAIISIYLVASYYVSEAILNIYDYVVSNTPVMFQEFHKIFISTRVGSLLFIIIVLFILFYVFENYVYGVISDTLLLTKKLAKLRIYSLFKEELSNSLKMSGPINTLFMRTILFVIFYYVYGLLYPGLETISKWFMYHELFIIFYIITWFLVSFIVYAIIKKIVYRALTIQRKLVYPRISYKSFYISLFLLVLYVSLIALLSSNDLGVMFYRAFNSSLGKPVYNGFLTKEITRIYLNFSNKLYSYINWYVAHVVKAYNKLADIINKALKFLWG